MPEIHPIYDAKLIDMSIAVFDLETTGLFPSKHAIIQIAAVQVDDGQPAEEWMDYVNPGGDHRPIPAFIEEFTGIQDSQLDQAPDLTTAMQKFDVFVGTRIVAGHNVRDFDLRFIRRAEFATGIDVQSDYYIDTLKIMRRLHPQLSSKSLKACGEFYGIEFDPGSLHDALADTRLAAQVMQLQFAELGEREVETFGQMIEFLS